MSEHKKNLPAVIVENEAGVEDFVQIELDSQVQTLVPDMKKVRLALAEAMALPAHYWKGKKVEIKIGCTVVPNITMTVKPE